MYLRCPISLSVAIGFTIVFAVLITIKAEARDLSSTMITQSITSSTIGSWIWWGIRYTVSSGEDKRQNKDTNDAENTVRQLRSK